MTIKTYEALPGVEWVNGQPVPKNREIAMTPEQARFDLDHGRVQLKKDGEPAAEKPKG